MATSPGRSQLQPVTQASFSAYSGALQAAALNTTRLAATSLPSDLPFHRSIDPTLAHDVDEFSARVLGLTGKLIMLANGPGTGKATALEEEDVVDGFLRTVVDSMEGMLEKADGALDEYLGRKKAPSIPVSAGPANLSHHGVKKEQHPRGRLDPALTHASHLPKPQLKFRHRPSNSDESSYIPALSIPHKWCAKVPLGYVFQHERSEDDDNSNLDEEAEIEKKRQMIHPYYYELTSPTYPDHVLNPPKICIQPTPLDPSSSHSSRTLTFVSTVKSLHSLAETLSTATEIAVDLEHHSYRSYRGFLALMQVSTREEDFIVDLLVPEVREGLRQSKDKGKSVEESECERMAREAGESIARVFADPSIIKVFHGAESDVVWLQQDFNIFVVGLFDTFHASKVLEFPKHGLANLLETYCDFVPDKRYQLADWRIRPLPIEMLIYARSDTHFLLYIYDRLRLALIERALTILHSSEHDEDSLATSDTNPTHTLIHTVLSRSSRTALRLYEVDVYDANEGSGTGGWDTLARKWNKAGLVNEQRALRTQYPSGSPSVQGVVYRAVHRWREEVAREEDESTRYVLPTHHLFLLAEHPPSTVDELLALFGGHAATRGVPPLLRRRAGELVEVIKNAMASVSHESTGKEAVGMDDGDKVSWEDVDVKLDASSGSNAILTSTSAGDLGLWSFPTPPSAAITVESSLFGVSISHGLASSSIASSSSASQGSISHTTEMRPYVATRSTLFGNAVAGIVTSSPTSIQSTSTSRLRRAQASSATSERFQTLVSRIHRTLIVAPTLPTVSASKTQGVTRSSVTSAGDIQSLSETGPATPEPSWANPAAQVEIPFVPAHQRQSTSNSFVYTPLEDDTIVVVGQAGARQKKRKRDKNRGVVSKPAVEASGGNNNGAVAEFDYASVPNLLDEDPAESHLGAVGEESVRRKKRKQGKGFGLFESGNFRAPPKDGREVKSGNKTHTFR